MEIIGDLIKILLPSAAILYGMYLVVRSFLTKDLEKKLLEHKQKSIEIVLPIRLQAYERMCLFLERITPHNMIVRVNQPSFNVAMFQQQLLHEIREEYNHNMSQQVYMSEAVWQQVKNAKEDIISLINTSAESLDPGARSIELAKAIFDNLMTRPHDPVASALKALKNEISASF